MKIDYSKIGKLIVHRQMNTLGVIEKIDYSWEGPPEVLISHDLLCELNFTIDNHEKINIGPYRLRLIENDYWQGRSHYIRMDYPLWWLRVLSYRMTRVFDLIYRRFILTLAVWGMADYNAAAIPHRKDIHFPWNKRGH